MGASECATRLIHREFDNLECSLIKDDAHEFAFSASLDRTMKRSRHTEEQIIAILKEQEAGSKTADVCRKHGISSATFYHWKAKYGGLSVSEAKRLRALERENARLKKLFADTMLDNAMLKDLLSKKW